MKFKKIALLILLAILFSLNLDAKETSGGTSGVGGGGDGKIIRSLILKAKREQMISRLTYAFTSEDEVDYTTLKSQLRKYAYRSYDLGNLKANAILQDMIAKEFGYNLRKVKFVASKKCVDSEGIERSASTLMNQPSADICFNPERIVDDFGPYIQDSDLLGLMMHELAHHYGYEDKDHFFAASIAMEHQKLAGQYKDDLVTNYLVPY